MKKIAENFKNGYIALSERNVISFDPPAYGRLMRNIFSGDYVIAEHSRTVPVSFNQAEKIIENNF